MLQNRNHRQTQKKNRTTTNLYRFHAKKNRMSDALFPIAYCSFQILMNLFQFYQNQFEHFQMKIDRLLLFSMVQMANIWPILIYTFYVFFLCGIEFRLNIMI